MGRYCIVCGKEKLANDPDFHMFKVPSDEKQRTRWMLSLQTFLPSYAYVCSEHFHPHSFLGGRLRKKGALPSKEYAAKDAKNSHVDDFTILILRNNTPMATRGGYTYEMLRESANNIVTWTCFKEKTERCQGRLTSSNGVVLKEFKHSCKQDFTTAEMFERLYTEEKEKEKDSEVIEVRPSEDSEVIEVRPSEGSELIEVRPSEDPEVIGVRPSEGSEVIEVRPSEGSEVIEVRPSEDSEVIEVRPSEDQEVIEVRPSEDSEVIEVGPSEDSEAVAQSSESTPPEIASPSQNEFHINDDQVVCRLCLEPTDKNFAFHLKSIEASCSNNLTENNVMFVKMIQSFLPDFVVDITVDHVMCLKCKQLLVSSYNFIQQCKSVENKIHLYKTKFAPNDRISCEDVARAQTKPIIDKIHPPKKKRKTYHNDGESSSTVKSRTNNFTRQKNCRVLSNLESPAHSRKSESAQITDQLYFITPEELSNIVKEEREDVENDLVANLADPLACDNSTSEGGEVSVSGHFLDIDTVPQTSSEKYFLEIMNSSRSSYIVVLPKGKSDIGKRKTCKASEKRTSCST